MKTWSDYFFALRRRPVIRPRRAGPLVAWDLETSRIPERIGDPLTIELKYVTAHGEPGPLASEAIPSFAALAEFMCDTMLTTAAIGSRYVTWNGLRFDILLAFKALRDHARSFMIRPYVAGGGAIRGATVLDRKDPKRVWYLYDGMAMTYVQTRLDEFLKIYAPEYRKHLGAIDWSKEEFNPRNPAHRAYAERDSEGLYHGIVRVDEILRSLTGRGVQCTIGNAGIKFFESKIPEGVGVTNVPEALWTIIFDYALRGGYVYTHRQHDGPLWQYDLNQAYAAAMRDADLPDGRAASSRRYFDDRPGIYKCEISRSPRSPVPFYVRVDGEPFECFGDIPTTTHLCSNEIETLRAHGWEIKIAEGWTWPRSFRMEAMVDELEAIRGSCAGGPSGAIGTMVKALGNHSYGKTTERISPEDVVIAGECPEGHIPWRPEDPTLAGFWCTVSSRPIRDRRRYHRPQIGAFITAHVRCVLYDAIMRAPEAFVKADTDSIAFDRPVDFLDIDSKRYGAWKIEIDGERTIVIGKKVYCKTSHPWDDLGIPDLRVEPTCKGLSVRRLDLGDFERWLDSGEPPVQTMVQTLGWRSALDGNRYRIQERHGTDFRKTAPHLYERPV